MTRKEARPMNPLAPPALAALLLAPQPAFADVSSGGSAIGMAQAAMDAVLVVTASALFVACAVTIVQRFLSTSDQIASDGGYAFKRVSGAFAIMFTIVLLAKGGTSIAQTFADAGTVSWYGTTAELVVTSRTAGQSLGGWSDGQSSSFNDLKKSADLALADRIEKERDQYNGWPKWLYDWVTNGADHSGGNYE